MVEGDGLKQFSKFLNQSKTWRVAVNVQHRFEPGYEPSDLNSVQVEFRQPAHVSAAESGPSIIGKLQTDSSTSEARLERSGEIVVACGDSGEKVLVHFRELVGRTLLRVEVAPLSGSPFPTFAALSLPNALCPMCSNVLFPSKSLPHKHLGPTKNLHTSYNPCLRIR